MGRFERQQHDHAWPADRAGWDELLACRRCGLDILRCFVASPEWVVRRVESIEFVDDRTVRRRVSADYAVPPSAPVLRLDDGRGVRVLPLAMMRRKSMVNFDFRDHDGRPMPLLGLRENQVLTLAVVRAWTAALLEEGGTPCPDWPQMPGELQMFLHDVVVGDRDEVKTALARLQTAWSGRRDRDKLDAVLERLCSTFILFGLEHEAPGVRRVVKWSYDEPLTLLYSTSSYQGHEHGPCPGNAARDGTPDQRPAYGAAGVRQHRWAPDPLLASLGLQPTLVRFPVPGAELTASFHLEVTAPPEVSIVEASLLAGQPNLRYGDTPDDDRAEWEAIRDRRKANRTALFDPPPRRRPSFDSVRGGDPTVDLHVADVPYGSLSRAQVELQANPSGWLGIAWATTLLATVLLAAACFMKATSGEATTVVLLTYAAAMVTFVVRPDPHLMVTRLLVLLRMVAAISAVLLLVAAALVAFPHRGDVQVWLGVLAVLSLGPTAVLSAAWGLARRRILRERPPHVWPRRAAGAKDGYRLPEGTKPGTDPARLRTVSHRLREEARSNRYIRVSPWEQHRPGTRGDDERVDTEFPTKFGNLLEAADYPYDEAAVRLGFDRPGIKVASSEGDRTSFLWTAEFEADFWRVLTGGRTADRA